MKIKQHLFILIVAVALWSTLALAQSSSIKKASVKYVELDYSDAAKGYEQIAIKGYKSQELFQKLGNSYYFNGELVTAAKWYEQLFLLGEVSEPEYYYRYAQCLKATNKEQEANQILDEFAKRANQDSRAVQYLNKKDYLANIKLNSASYQIENAAINSSFSDYGTAYYQDKIVFASSRDVRITKRKIHGWTGLPFTNLYAATLNAECVLGPVATFSKSISSKFNESTPIFTRDGKTVYFTRNNYNKGRRGKNQSKVTLLKIYRAQLKNGKWEAITELPFCSNNYNVAHPALSPDEQTLYFASDMPGTIGQSDLFKVAVKSDGTFGTAENLGREINTEGRETFPFISNDGMLYFASDGHLGLGGLDVFEANLNPNSSNNPTVQNLGLPINSAMDDFGLVFNQDKINGFVTSNREGGHGMDDIYSFKKCDVIVKGTVVNATTNLPIANAALIISDYEHQKIQETVADDMGQFEFKADCTHDYQVRATKEGFEAKELAFKTANTSEIAVVIPLLKNKIPIAAGLDLAKVLNIKMINFDLGKSEIREDAAIELAKIVVALQENPTIKLSIRSHTDSRQSKLYNEQLSDRRAKSTREYLIKQGIASDRLTAKGYGESQLLNPCSDGIKCSESDHQKNRRSEFIIVE